MKTLKLISLAMLSVALVSFYGCDDDEPEEEVSPFVGEYIITEAVLSEPLTLTTNEAGDITVPVDTDITQMIQTALLGAIECTPENTLIEMREDFTLFLSCMGTETELDAGTWEEVSETVLKLNMNSTAIPSSPTGIVLTVSDVTIEDDVLSGETTVPLPREMLAAVVAVMSGGLATLNMEATPVAVPVTFIISLAVQ